MSARIAVLSDVHGNATALDAVRKAFKKDKPDAVIVAGDLVMNGPEPAAAIDALREMEAAGATIVQGNTDIAVADFDYGAAFPWLTDGVPDTYRAAAEWAASALPGAASSAPRQACWRGTARPRSASRRPRCRRSRRRSCP